MKSIVLPHERCVCNSVPMNTRPLKIRPGTAFMSYSEHFFTPTIMSTSITCKNTSLRTNVRYSITKVRGDSNLICNYYFKPSESNIHSKNLRILHQKLNCIDVCLHKLVIISYSLGASQLLIIARTLVRRIYYRFRTRNVHTHR